MCLSSGSSRLQYRPSLRGGGLHWLPLSLLQTLLRHLLLLNMKMTIRETCRPSSLLLLCFLKPQKFVFIVINCSSLLLIDYTAWFAKSESSDRMHEISLFMFSYLPSFVLWRRRRVQLVETRNTTTGFNSFSQHPVRKLLTFKQMFKLICRIEEEYCLQDENKKWRNTLCYCFVLWNVFNCLKNQSLAECMIDVCNICGGIKGLIPKRFWTFN